MLLPLPEHWRLEKREEKEEVRIGGEFYSPVLAGR